MRCFLFILFITLGIAATGISTGAKKNVKDEKPASSPHPYAKEFEKYGISDDYKNRVPAKGLTDKEKREVNNLIDDMARYFLSRIDENGKIPALQQTPSENDAKKLPKDDPQGWPAYYRSEVVTEFFRAIVIVHKIELEKEDEDKLLSALKYAMGRIELWRFEVGNNPYRSEDLANLCGEILLLGEALGAADDTPIVKEARKLVAKQMKRIRDYMERTWNEHAIPLFNQFMHRTCPPFARTFYHTLRPIQALTLNPRNVSKRRVQIVEAVFKLLVESAYFSTKSESVPRYLSISKDDKGDRDGATTRVRGMDDAKDGTIPLDLPISWSDAKLADKYCVDETTRARKRRAEASKHFEDGTAATTLDASLIFLDSLRYLESPEVKKLVSKETQEIIEESKKLLWNINAFLVAGFGDELQFKSRYGVRVLVGSLSRQTMNEVDHDLLNTSNYYFAARVASALKRERFGSFEWYAEIARDLLTMRVDSADGALDSPDENANFDTRRFLPNLYALLILRKQPVSEDTEKDPTKPVSGEAKPAEGEGDDKAPKAPAKTPEKTSDGKANKQD